MDMMRSTVDAIDDINEGFYASAQKRLDNLTKPPGSLGRLEEFARRIVAITEIKILCWIKSGCSLLLVTMGSPKKGYPPILKKLPLKWCLTS